MTRRNDQLDHIEASLARLEAAVAGHATHLRDQAAALRIEVSHARASAEAAHAGVQALADMLPVPSPDDSTAPAAADGGTEAGSPSAVRRLPKTLKRDQEM